MKIILIVDDEVDVTSTYAMLLQLHGFRTLTAANGRQALEVMAATPPDIVLSDCMMPLMDGIELSRRLRGDPRTAAIPIILMSAAPERHALSRAGYDVFLQKPVRFQELLAAIERLLPRR
ncbi:MAG TPA: response regulator [Noviherbaspirillum sp.]|uniref:response regulator n=1 Tax=Noviherbaspirillum sp. TaxID=1926288 RepID=UPI002D685C4A|nr:response regulator [Noviherbaspirillum sp.]HYD94125.1 response regulator [Noviherbaspirillum sp.]